MAEARAAAATGAVTEATKATLGAWVASPLGAAALVLAARIDAAATCPESGGSLAALVRELRSTLAAATKKSAEADVIDELRARRERRIGGTGPRARSELPHA